jgi:hypothetical protein
MTIGKVGNIAVSGVVEIAQRYEAAGNRRIACQAAIDEYLDRPEYKKLCKALRDADAAWRAAGAEYETGRLV